MPNLFHIFQRTALLAFCVALSLLAIGSMDASARTTGDQRKPEDITYVVVHAIGGPECRGDKPFFAKIQHDASWWADWFARQEVIGIHYVIDRSGDLVASTPELVVANHARGHNRNSIGIELVNDGDGLDPYPPEQVDRLVQLLTDLRERYGLKVDAIKGHAELDNGKPLPCGIARKVDPGPALDLQAVIEASNP